MTHARKYPPANTTAQWFEDKYDRAVFSVIDKLLLHTTETSSWPGYDGGAKAPNATYNPWAAAGWRWRQHNWLNTSSRALQDPTSTPVRENRDNVVQVEIIAYCNPVSYRKYGFGVNALPDHFYEDMGAFLAFLHTEWEVPLVHATGAAYPPPDSIRFTSSQYDAFRGVLGHQNASGNDHGDPGLTNDQLDRIISVARRLTAPKTPAPTGGVATSGGTNVSVYDDSLAADIEYGKRLWGEGGTAGEFMQRTDARLTDIINRLIRIEADTDATQAALAAKAAPLLAADAGTGTLRAVPAEQDSEPAA